MLNFIKIQNKNISIFDRETEEEELLEDALDHDEAIIDGMSSVFTAAARHSPELCAASRGIKRLKLMSNGGGFRGCN